MRNDTGKEGKITASKVLPVYFLILIQNTLVLLAPALLQKIVEKNSGRFFSNKNINNKI
jgi:hypothetical protein